MILDRIRGREEEKEVIVKGNLIIRIPLDHVKDKKGRPFLFYKIAIDCNKFNSNLFI